MPLGKLFGLSHLNDLDDVRMRQQMALQIAGRQQNPWAAGLHGLAGALLGRRASKLRQQHNEQLQAALQEQFGDSPHFGTITVLGPQFGKSLLANQVTSALFGGQQQPPPDDARNIQYLIDELGMSPDQAVQYVHGELGGTTEDPARIRSMNRLMEMGVPQEDALGYVFGELQGDQAPAQRVPNKELEIQSLVERGISEDQAIEMVYHQSPLVQLTGSPRFPDPPKGYIYRREEDGTIRIGEDGLPISTPIPGGPADPKVKEAIAAENYRRAKGAVVGQLDFIEEAVRGSPNLTTGLFGAALSKVPGTPAHDIHNSLNTIRSNIGFDRLRDMRAASQTGGALGQVSNKELTLLVDSLSPTSQTVSPDRFLEAMAIIRRIYERPHRYDEFFGLGDGLFPDGSPVQEEQDASTSNDVDALFELLQQ